MNMYFVKTKKKNFSRKAFITLALCAFLMVSTPRPAHAWAGMALISAEIFKQTLEAGFAQLQGVLLMQLKMMAVQLLNSSLEQLIGGINGSGILFISDWQQYLFKMPAEANRVFMNDFLSQTTRGKCSSLNFLSSSKGKFDSNYFTILCNSAQWKISTAPPYVNIDQYSADPVRSLREGDWRVFNSLLSNPANNPIGYSIIAEAVQAQDLEKRRQAAQAEAVANQGYNSVKVGGVTVTPGRTVADLVQNVKTLGNNILMAANNPAELAGGVIVSIANRAMNQMLQRGFDIARTKIQREIGKVNQQIYRTAREINKTLGPASQYLQDVNQTLGNINSMRIKTGGAPPSCVNAGNAGC